MHKMKCEQKLKKKYIQNRNKNKPKDTDNFVRINQSLRKKQLRKSEHACNNHTANQRTLSFNGKVFCIP